MRTQEEIARRCAEATGTLDFTRNALAAFLDYDHARPFLKPEVTAAEWEAEPLSREAVLEAMRDYMPFAWEKALDERGLSAVRSVSKMRAWLWLLGDEEMVAFASGENYAPYGRPILKAICLKYGFPMPQWEQDPDAGGEK